MPTELAKAAQHFVANKQLEENHARQSAAFLLATGVDLNEAIAAKGDARKHCLARLDRLLERERLKGAGRHWSYDLNRHIALKQARDRLTQSWRDEQPCGQFV